MNAPEVIEEAMCTTAPVIDVDECLLGLAPLGGVTDPARVARMSERFVPYLHSLPELVLERDGI